MDYAYSLADYYDCGAVIEQKSFSFDAENQQWLEGAGSGRDIEKEIRQMSYEGDQRLFVPSKWTVELRSTGVVAVSLELYMAEMRFGSFWRSRLMMWCWLSAACPRGSMIFSSPVCRLI